MKWLRRLLTRKKKTPLPPKPYVDTSSWGSHMVDARFYDSNDLAHIDPDKPHWQDPRFDSREKVPFFDVFGFNRDWSWSLYKFSSLFIVALFYWEVRTVLLSQSPIVSVCDTASVSAVPDYARDENATEEELRAAGYAYVGFKKMDNLQDVMTTSERKGSSLP